MKQRGAAVFLVLLLGTPEAAHAAQRVPFGCGEDLRANTFAAPLPLETLCEVMQSGETLAPDAGRAFLYSLVLPGAGQKTLGQRRWIAYAAVEVIAWFEFARTRRAGNRLRGEYRTLAWDVARTFAGARVDGDFTYYETLTHFTRSGAFDADPATPGLQPEEDPATFNGSMWALAMSIFFAPGTTPGPGDLSFEQALAFYRERGYDEAFLWDWTGSEAELLRYRDLIRDSDDRFRRSSLMAGAVLANHLVSALDAFLSARVRSATNERLTTSLRTLPDRGGGTRLELGLSVRP